jgi:hypothetical protein
VDYATPKPPVEIEKRNTSDRIIHHRDSIPRQRSSTDSHSIAFLIDPGLGGISAEGNPKRWHVASLSDPLPDLRDQFQFLMYGWGHAPEPVHVSVKKNGQHEKRYDNN